MFAGSLSHIRRCQGAIAESLVSKIQQTGGVATLDDFAAYSVFVQPAFEGSYRGKKVFTSHPPTSGIVLLHMLNLLEHYDLPKEGLTPLNLHRLVEAMKFAAAARTRLGDPAYRVDENTAEIPTKEFAAKIALNITDVSIRPKSCPTKVTHVRFFQDSTHDVDYYNPVYDVMEDHGTVRHHHLKIANSVYLDILDAPVHS